MANQNKAVANLTFELGMQKKLSHVGSKFAGVKHTDTLAEHSNRAAQLAYMLAFAEEVSPEHVAAMCSFHDMGEVRVGDQHKISARYFDIKPFEKNAMLEQTGPLPEPMRTKIRTLWNEFHDQKTKAAHVARDADLLETMFQAKEYLDTGFEGAERWLKNGSKLLKTKSAKKLFAQLKKVKFNDWWDKLN